MQRSGLFGKICCASWIASACRFQSGNGSISCKIFCFCKIIVMKFFGYERVGSTNDICFEKFANNEALPFAVMARQQTQGRGQFGRTWYSGDPQNLYISFAFRPQSSTKAFQNFSLKVAEVLTRMLE
ncbi:MAG: hypothetical protein K2L24_01085, partial [Opitutales bacterium]|nr:hypothetical protein [Opitutales bacterium]